MSFLSKSFSIIGAVEFGALIGTLIFPGVGTLGAGVVVGAVALGIAAVCTAMKGMSGHSQERYHENQIKGKEDLTKSQSKDNEVQDKRNSKDASIDQNQQNGKNKTDGILISTQKVQGDKDADKTKNSKESEKKQPLELEGNNDKESSLEKKGPEEAYKISSLDKESRDDLAKAKAQFKNCVTELNSNIQDTNVLPVKTQEASAQR